MSPRIWLLRFLALVSLSVWVGGFTLYGGAVIPILHDQIGIPATAAITRRVTDLLNAIGGVSVLLWLALVLIENATLRTFWGRARLGLLGLSILSLGSLVVLHAIMDGRLESGRMTGFYQFHRAYLLASTIGWAANLGLIGASLRVWSAGDGVEKNPESE